MGAALVPRSPRPHSPAMPRQPLNVVILGGSFAGLAVAHHFLDRIVHQLSTFEGAPAYRVVLVSPSTHLYWNICAPRVLVSPSLISPEDAFIPIEPAFARHPFDKFTFMQGWATGVDTSAKKVTIELVRNVKENRLSGVSKASSSTAETNPANISFARDMNYRTNTADRNSTVQTISYHALVLATGSSTYSPLYSLHGTHEDTLAELRAFHRRLETAHSVMIVGGGPSGVETAGQLATYYNQKRRWRTFKEKRHRSDTVTDPNALERANKILFPPRKKRDSATPAPMISPRERHIERQSKRDSCVSGQSSTAPPTILITPPAPERRTRKTITLLSGGARLLPKLPPTVSKKAERKLKKLGVHIVHNLREIGNTTNADGTTNCILNNDMTITSDVLISATGVYPNTRFLPQHMLDENGYVITDPQTLRVYAQGVGQRVYAVGDCANYSKNYTLDVYEAVPILMKNLQNDLLTHEYKLQTVTSMPHGEAHKTGPTQDSSRDTEAKPTAASNAFLTPPRESTTSSSKALSESEPPPSPTLPLSPISETISIHLAPSLPEKSSTTPPSSNPVPALPSPPISPISSTIPSQLLPRIPLLTSAEARQKIAALEDAHYHQNPTDSQLMPITRFGGVGVIFDWRIPSFLVYLMKGRKYRLGRAEGAVGRGRDPYAVR